MSGRAAIFLSRQQPNYSSFNIHTRAPKSPGVLVDVTKVATTVSEVVTAPDGTFSGCLVQTRRLSSETHHTRKTVTFEEPLQAAVPDSEPEDHLSGLRELPLGCISAAADEPQTNLSNEIQCVSGDLQSANEPPTAAAPRDALPVAVAKAVPVAIKISSADKEQINASPSADNVVVRELDLLSQALEAPAAVAPPATLPASDASAEQKPPADDKERSLPLETQAAAPASNASAAQASAPQPPVAGENTPLVIKVKTKKGSWCFPCCCGKAQEDAAANLADKNVTQLPISKITGKPMAV